MPKATIGVPERFLSKSEVGMKRRFFRSFKARIPRKLKKAAKYGVEKRVYPTEIKKSVVPSDMIFKYDEKVEYLIIGRRTKWKLKARYEIIKEHKRILVEMWHEINDRIISW